MNQVDILLQQTQNAYDWANRVIKSIPYEKWDTTPDIIESNIAWQTGHLIVSYYFHSIMVIKGHQMDILQKLPFKEYSGLFTTGSPAELKGKIDAAQLYEHLLFMEQRSLEIIRSLNEEDLQKELEPSPIPHPIATTKLEALDWNIKHTMYHCGQVGLIKRVVDQRYDFGLKA